MKLKQIHLQNYRNYSELDLAFPENINIFLGENAQGKTNLLESIYVLAFTKSHRSHNERELIQFGHDFAKLDGQVETQHQTLPLEVIISSKGKKTKVNRIDQKKLSDYVGQFRVILFSPEDLYLVKGAPANRRKFIDMELGQIRPLYLHQLVSYQLILKQRNAYLKQSFGGKFDPLYFDVLSQQLVESGSLVLFHRLNFLNKLEKLAQAVHHGITYGKEVLSLHYESNLPLEEGMSLNEIETLFTDALKKNQQREKLRQTTFVGPHRDDLAFKVNGQNVQLYGSQGQQRTTALSLKLAEIDLIFEETGEYPVLLLDDVLSELDNARQVHLLKTIENKVQTFITTTTLEHLENKMAVKPAIFHVQQGKIERERNES